MDNPYLKLDVETASPLRRVIMLYEEAILSMYKVRDSIEKNRVKEKIESISRAQKIFGILNMSLDMEKGGEIAENLRSLYEFIENSLVKVNASNDVRLLDDLIEIVANLKSAWEEIESKI